eukprot:CAMPEP_0197072760 /NCGR_PEP_ID=MMETSP1384-20130603/210259_1 /TAXON_ID=29189 /ORGANISM="Ammonia sp." /LENGTH=549 /DNA_ID=CAMNT_0042511581 /DNA_START=50 /DNA_END=1699 /DNA_ORIENTATION=+
MLANQHQLCSLQALQNNGAFDKCHSSWTQSIHVLENQQKPENNTNSNPRWYYKTDDDEFELYGFDEQMELEQNYQAFMHGNRVQPTFEMESGYFANCDDRHCIDLFNFVQHNLDSNESRRILRVVDDNELDSQFVQINSDKVVQREEDHNIHNNEKSTPKQYCSLQRNVLAHVYNTGGDAIQIASILNDIVNDSLFVQAQQYDIPIAAAVIERPCKISKQEYHKQVDVLLDSFSNNRVAAMDIIRFYQYNLKVNSSLISYLISEQRCNFILYDTDFHLLAVGKYHGDYIHQYGERAVNPYRYQAFIKFHAMLTAFYERSLTAQANMVQIKSLVSSLNHQIRCCLMYDTQHTVWTPSIANRHHFKQMVNSDACIMAKNLRCNKIECDAQSEAPVEPEEEESSHSMSDIDLCRDGITITTEYECDVDETKGYASDYTVDSNEDSVLESVVDSGDETDDIIECSICYEVVSHSTVDSNEDSVLESVVDSGDETDDIIECSICYEVVSHSTQFHSHQDLCHSCLNQWKANGHHSCPKCGTAHILNQHPMGLVY